MNGIPIVKGFCCLVSLFDNQRKMTGNEDPLFSDGFASLCVTLGKSPSPVGCDQPSQLDGAATPAGSGRAHTFVSSTDIKPPQLARSSVCCFLPLLSHTTTWGQNSTVHTQAGAVPRSRSVFCAQAINNDDARTWRDNKKSCYAERKKIPEAQNKVTVLSFV